MDRVIKLHSALGIAADDDDVTVETADLRAALAELDRLREQGRFDRQWVTTLERVRAEYSAELERLRTVIREYVAEVESGEKFDALVCSVPGLVSDDGMYGGPA